MREARKRGWEISNFLGFLGIVGADGARAKNFWIFENFGVKTKFFEFFGKFEFFGFQKGRRYELILY